MACCICWRAEAFMGEAPAEDEPRLERGKKVAANLIDTLRRRRGLPAAEEELPI